MFLMLLLMAAAPATPEGPPMVGVLEEYPCGGAHERSVRVVFAKSPEGWQALRSWDSARGMELPTEWTVAFDGRAIGRFRTVVPKPSGCPFSCGIGLAPEPGGPLPEVKAPPGVFEWDCGEPRARPLVVNSGGFFADPDQWKPLDPGAIDMALVFKHFREVAGDAVSCPPGADRPVPLAYSARDLRVRSHRDRSGRQLVTTWLPKDLDTCDAPGEAAWASHTFVLEGGLAKHLGAEITLVDAGDYDNDGTSELLFWRSSHHGDGYALFDHTFEMGLKVYRGYH